MNTKSDCTASNLKYLRLLHGYTQDEIAEAVHLSRCTYAQFEHGRKMPTTDTLLLLSRLYKISMDTILQTNPDKMISLLMHSDRCRNGILSLLEIYRRLSVQGKAALLAEAENLLQEERTYCQSHTNCRADLLP